MAIGIEMFYGPTLIPVWFYSYSALAYLIVAGISFLISYFSFKLHRMSSVKANLFLSLSFLVLGIAFSLLFIASFYTYLYEPHFKVYENLATVNHLSYSYYYALSLVSYLILASIYLPARIKNKLFILYVPLWYIDSTSFHVLSILILGYVLLANVINCFRKRKKNSYLVTLCFLALVIFHVLLLFASFDVSLYLIAHTILALGFGSLLTMLIRVSVK